MRYLLLYQEKKKMLNSSQVEKDLRDAKNDERAHVLQKFGFLEILWNPSFESRKANCHQGGAVLVYLLPQRKSAET